MGCIRSEIRHHQAIRALGSQYDCFAPTVRLMSLWLSKNYFSGHLSPRQIELIVASVFVDSAYPAPPTTSLAAFHRSLQKLALHDFTDTPIFVHFGDSAATPNSYSYNTRSIPGHVPFSVVSYSTNVPNQDDIAHDLVDMSILHILQIRALSIVPVLGYCGVVNDAVAVTDKIFEGELSLLHIQCNFILEFSADLCCSPATSNLLCGPKFSMMKVYANSGHVADPTKQQLVTGDDVTNLIQSKADPHWCESSIEETGSIPQYASGNVIQERFIEQLRRRHGRFAQFFWDDTDGRVVGVALRPTVFLPTPSFLPIDTRCRVDSLLTRKSKSEDSFNSSSNISVKNEKGKVLNMNNSMTSVSRLASDILASGKGIFADIHFN